MKKFTILVLLITSFFSLAAQNEKIVSSHITYKNLSQKNYEIKLHVVRMCSGNLANICDTLEVYSRYVKKFVKLNLESARPVLPNSNCPAKSECDGGSNPYSFQERVYSVTLDLAALKDTFVYLEWHSRDEKWHDRFAYGYRAGCISFVNVVYGNSSVFFDNEYRFVYPYNQSVTYNNRFIDTVDTADDVFIEFTGIYERDLIKCYMCGTCPNQCGDHLTWLKANVQQTINKKSGAMTVKPTEKGKKTNYALYIEEQRVVNGVLQMVGYVYFENTIAVVDDTTNNPVSVTTTLGKSAYFGKQYTWSVKAADKDSLDSISVSYLYRGPKIKLDSHVRYGNEFKYYFTFLDSTEIGMTVFFNVKVSDNHCDLPSTLEVLSSVDYYHGLFPDQFEMTKFKASCNEVGWVVANKKPFLHPVKIYWYDPDKKQDHPSKNDTLIVKYSKVGWHRMELTLLSSNGESVKYRDSLYLDSVPVFGYVAATRTTCKNEPLKIDLTYESGVLPVTYLWQDSIYADSRVFSLTDSITFKVRMTDANGCFLDSFLKINVHKTLPEFKLHSSRNVVCKNEMVDISVDHKSFIQGTTTHWNDGDTGSWRSFKITSASNFIVTAVDSNNCRYSDSIKVAMIDPTFFKTPDISECLNDTVRLSAEILNLDSITLAKSEIKWENSIVSSNYSFVAIQDRKIVVDFNAGGVCARHDSILFKVNSLPKGHVSDSVFCRNETRKVAFVNEGITPISELLWDGGYLHSDSFRIDGSKLPFQLGVWVRDQNLCRVYVETFLDTLPLPSIYFSSANYDTVCEDFGAITLTAQPYGGSWSGQSITRHGVFNTKVSGPGILLHTYSFTNTFNCTSSAVYTTVVHAMPGEPVISADKLSGNSPLQVKFSDTSGNVYDSMQWIISGPSGQQSGTGATFTTTLSDTGWYTVTLIGKSGLCMQSSKEANYIYVHAKGTNVVKLNAQQVVIYPNPAQDKFTINLPDNSSEITVTIIDLHGRTVETKIFAEPSGAVDVSHFAPGVYFVVVSGQDLGQRLFKINVMR